VASCVVLSDDVLFLQTDFLILTCRQRHIKHYKVKFA